MQQGESPGAESGYSKAKEQKDVSQNDPAIQIDNLVLDTRYLSRLVTIVSNV